MRRATKAAIPTIIISTLLCLGATLNQAKASVPPVDQHYIIDKICILDPATGDTLYQADVRPAFVNLLVGFLPDRFARVLSVDICDDGLDNDCSGEADEQCELPPRDETPCESCMRSACSNETEACKEDEQCLTAARCVIETQCDDHPLGIGHCYCGSEIGDRRSEIGVGACAEIDDGNFPGACGTELSPDPNAKFYDSMNRNPSIVRARDVLRCRENNCKADCGS